MTTEIESLRQQLASQGEALVIQPADTALKAWLGEPALYTWQDSDKCHHFTTNKDKAPKYAKPLYSPKGMTKE